MQVGLQYGLPLLSPVDDAGIFTTEAGPFKGLQVNLFTVCFVKCSIANTVWTRQNTMDNLSSSWCCKCFLVAASGVIRVVTLFA